VFAKAYNTDYQTLIDLIGQDPDKVINSAFPLHDPRSRRSVAINEIVVVGLMLGFSSTPVIPELELEHNSSPYVIRCFEDLMSNTIGVIMCTPKHAGKQFSHAVYWNGSMVDDPNGTIYTLADLLVDYSIDAYWVVKYIAQKSR